MRTIKKLIKKISTFLFNFPKRIGLFFRKLFKGKKYILIYSQYVVMDSYVMQYYNNIKELNYKVKFIFFSNNNGVTSVDKERYKKYDLPKKLIIKSKTAFCFSNPNLIVAADLYIMARYLFPCKKLQLDHSCGIPTICATNHRDQVYIFSHSSFINGKPPFDLYFEPCKSVVKMYEEKEPLFKNKIWYVGNKLLDKFETEKTKYQEYRTQLGIKENQKVVALFGSWNKESLFHKLENSLFDEIKKLSENKNYKFIVSIHPKEYSKYNNDIEPLGAKVDELADYGVIVRKPGENSFPFIVASDLMIVDYSSIGEDAIMCDKNIVYTEFSYEKIYLYSIHERLKGKVPVLKEAKDLEKIINMSYPKEAFDALQSIKEDTYAPTGFYKQQCIKATKYLLNEEEK